MIMCGVTFGLINKLYNMKSGYEIYEAYENSDPENSITANLGTISKLEMWDELSDDEKNVVLFAILRVETRLLGLNDIPKVRITDLDFCSGYDDEENVIYLSRDIYEKPSDVYKIVDSLSHEVYHAYQKEVIELYFKMYTDKKYEKERNLFLFRDAIIYSKEILEYENGFNDINKYLSQELERDAFQYGKKAVEEYRECVSGYLERNK